MLDSLVKYARNSKLESIWLSVLKNNERAICLYEKIGFILESELEDNLLKMKLVL